MYNCIGAGGAATTVTVYVSVLVPATFVPVTAYATAVSIDCTVPERTPLLVLNVRPFLAAGETEYEEAGYVDVSAYVVALPAVRVSEAGVIVKAGGLV